MIGNAGVDCRESSLTKPLPDESDVARLSHLQPSNHVGELQQGDDSDAFDFLAVYMAEIPFVAGDQ